MWIFLLLTIMDSFLIANTMLYETTHMYILLCVELKPYIYCRKAVGEYCDIQIARDYEIKLEIYYISIFDWTVLETQYIVYL